MKFKENVKILTDRGVFKEVKGTVIPYEDKLVNIILMIHASDNAWTPEAIEVSEQSTGCRLFSITNKALKDIKPTDVVNLTSEYIKSKGKKTFLNQIQKQINSNPKIYFNESVDK